MVAMKITLATAMRARDVSRPREEHLAEAAERDAALARPEAETPPSQPAAEAVPSERAPADDTGTGTRHRRRRER